MPLTLADGVRTSYLTKLIIDARIQPRNPNGRNLLVRVPQHCETVRDFKVHLLHVYLRTSLPINFFVDEFLIPDEEHSCIFKLFSDPIRVVPCLSNSAVSTTSVSPMSSISSSSRTPTQSALAVLPWRGPEYNRSVVMNLGQNGIDELDLSRRSDLARKSAFEVFKEPQIPPSNSEKRLTSSAKRRNRLRRAVELAAGAPQNTTTDSGIFDLTLTPENAAEQQPVITPISHKNAKGKIHQSTKAENSYTDLLEELEKKDKVYSSTVPRATGTKRKVTIMMTESFGSPALKKERTETMGKRPDTPRVPTSLKNPKALEIFNNLEFSSGKKRTGSESGLAYLQGKGRKLAQNLEDSPQTTSFDNSIPSSSKHLAHNGSGYNLNTMSDEPCIPQESQASSLIQLTDAEAGAAGPLDPNYYSCLPALTSADEISENSIIAFRLLEMGENYQPRLSEFKEALVIGKSDRDDIRLEYLKSNSVKTSGKFEIEGFESEDQENQVNFLKMNELKLVRSASTPDAMTETESESD